MKKRKQDKAQPEIETEGDTLVGPDVLPFDVADASNAPDDPGGPSDVAGYVEVWGAAEVADAAADEVAAEVADAVAVDEDITNRVTADTPEGPAAEAPPATPADASHVESILESLLFAADRPLTLTDLKRLLGERDGKRVTEALETLRARRDESGIQLVSVAGGWQLRTHPANGAWVAKLVAGRPPRLSRAMMETLSIVAYRQPITRPEIDEIRGVDCGPVLRTLLDRSFIRVIGKKEEVGRPILYGTTPEFLKTFTLRDLTELPSLREFHELGADDRARVDATGSDAAASDAAASDTAGEGASNLRVARPDAGSLSHPDPEEEDSLLGELDRAAIAAADASRSFADRDVNPEAAPRSSDPGEQ